jgi:hypothetical protein
MLRLYRQPTKGEFFIVFVDCAQGGIDSNFGQFMSKSRHDVPIVLQIKDVAANMTPIIHQTLEWLFSVTGVRPVVAFERNMGGSSEMERLRIMNRDNKYKIYIMKKSGTTHGERPTELLGWSTDAASRPNMLGDLKQAIDNRQIIIYDKETVHQLKTFIVNKRNRPEAAPNAHDDAVMSLAGVWQLYQTESPPQTTKSQTTSGNITSLWHN